MELQLTSRFKHAWNAFLNRDPTVSYRDIGPGYSYRPDRFRLTRGNERSIITSVYNRIIAYFSEKTNATNNYPCTVNANLAIDFS